MAKNAALAHAGLTADQVTVSKVDFDVEDGRMVYEVEFWANNVEYEYDVDATTGEIVKNHTETYTAAAGQNGSIDQAAAKAAALSAFGLSEDQAEGIVVIPSYDDGRFVYKVKFWAGGTEYFCAVDGSGQILMSEKEEHASSGSVATSGTDVGLEAAKAAALKHAGLSADQVTGLTAKLDWDDGQRVYEVDFWQGSTEYEYEINADGTVRQYESEAHAAPTAISAGSGSSVLKDEDENKATAASGSFISADEALDRALSHAGLDQSAIRELEMDSELDDDVPHYSIDFKSGNLEYEYEISATDGSVLKFEQDN